MTHFGWLRHAEPHEAEILTEQFCTCYWACARVTATPISKTAYNLAKQIQLMPLQQ